MQTGVQSDEIVFFDTEVSTVDERIADIGAVRTTLPVCSVNGLQFHSSSLAEFERFVKDAVFVCGHNIIHFDLKYVMPSLERAGVRSIIDTLYLSPLLFPMKPYHNLVKDDKLQSDDLNNPLNDSVKAMELFMDEVSAFERLSDNLKKIYATLLEMLPEFRGFFRYLNYHEHTNYLRTFVHAELKNKICENADIDSLAKQYPMELAYCLATISTEDKASVIPYWVQKNYPKVQEVYNRLRGIPCHEGCAYCRAAFDIHAQLKKKFGYEAFRKYNDEPLQEQAVQAGVDGNSLLAVFPTGGGKSITFQLPALIAGEAVHGLTVVISPLQSLMKDQVDNLSRIGITDAVTINGMLNAVERAEALERVENGIATILYISPESLRSKTIERLLIGRNVVRFVIDEAHCFSSWGHDFRVDYLYIGDFIAKLQDLKHIQIPVSCFTATAKQKVISDIREYFKQKLEVDLALYTTDATRTNLRYEVLYRENDMDKYATLRSLIEQKNCPTIVYASYTKKTDELAEKLRSDGFAARAFHGKMNKDEKAANQEAFIRGEVQVITATSAFGMGVDKKDVKLVVHYDISDSLENYIQEAGRAGRDENIQADCYVLFNENDLNKHFLMLNQTKLSIGEIQQVWKAVKELTRDRKRVCCSALEIARRAGWDDSVTDIETKVRIAVSALETAGYVKRGQNYPRVYADSLRVRNAQEAIGKINDSRKLDELHKEYAIRIVKKLISCRSRAAVDAEEAECRVDYIADHLGLEKKQVIEVIQTMREEELLANDKEMAVYVERGSLRAKGRNATIDRFVLLERFLIKQLRPEGQRMHYKEVNEEALEEGVKASTVNNIKLLLYFWIIKGYIKKPQGEINTYMAVVPQENLERLKSRFEKRAKIVKFIEEYFCDRARKKVDIEKERDTILVDFSVLDLMKAYNSGLMNEFWANQREIEEALLYLSKMNAYRMEGGFLVLYNAMEIIRIETDNKRRYKVEDYKQLKEFYNGKTQQIHIVGEYANMMVRNYEEALTFVNDYFHMEYKLFLTKYFKGSRLGEIDRNITPLKYQELFENLSDRQSEIMNDDTSKAIVVAAGPGSGKTKILVHKLASLMLLEDVKHEQLLLLTFSRAAAMEFKIRLVKLIGSAAHYVEIKTFHSYCFDLLGKVGNIENSKNVVYDATQMIRSGEVELDRITKMVLVLDEAQDMNEDEYLLVRALMERNEDMRVIAVGDDDQNIYEFRGSDSKYMASLLDAAESRKYELLENFRSSRSVVNTANEFVRLIQNRMKTGGIQSVKTEIGAVQIIRNTSFLESAIVNKMEAAGQDVSKRTTAVLTTTNEQAYLVTELLRQKGYRARLIQSNEGFSLYDLVELRYFAEELRACNVPVIADEEWEAAKNSMLFSYSGSSNLDACLYLLEQFVKSNEKKYLTDLEGFLHEAGLEDFYQAGKGEICVSTIHKAKGREFDDVYMLLSGQGNLTDSDKRRIYVGMTRAKSNLCMFHDSAYFNSISGALKAAGVQFLLDNNQYPQPEEIELLMTHKDMWLGFAETNQRQEAIKGLRAGMELQVLDEREGAFGKLYFAVKQEQKPCKVAACSKAFAAQLKLHQDKGYIPYSAKIQYVVKWFDKERGAEYDIILPIVRLRRKRSI